MHFSIEETITPDTVKNSDILRLYDEWQVRKTGESPPHIGSFDLESLWCRRDLMLVERVDNHDFHYLIYGANVSLASGFDMTGKCTSSLGSEVGRFFSRCYERCITEGRPLYTTNPAAHAALVTAWERILLPLSDDHGDVRYVLGFNRPLAFKHELLTRVLDAVTDVIIGLGFEEGGAAALEFTVLTVNKAAERFLGRSGYDLVGRNLSELQPDWRQHELGSSLIASVNHNNLLQFEWRCQNDQAGNGSGPETVETWYRVTISPFINGALIMMSDITTLKLHEQTLQVSNNELQRLANTDPLTSAKNRRFFFAAGEAESQRAVRYGLPLSVMLLDLDSFKIINDKYGHDAGDRSLTAVVNLLNSELRANDTLARLGGDEFAAILPHTREEEAFKLANRLRILIASNQVQVEADSICLACSFGVAEHDATDTTFSGLIRRADDALMKAKRLGKNRVCRASD